MPPKSSPFSIRISDRVLRRLHEVIGASGNEYTRSELIEKAVETFLALLTINPTMLEYYDPALDKSVTKKRKG